jgi:hypothetical protein
MNIFNSFKKVIQYAKEGYDAGYNGSNSSNVNAVSNFKKMKDESKKTTNLEKTTLDNSMPLTTEEIVSNICDWSVDLINDPSTSQKNAESIYSEFEEWIDPERNEIDIFYLDLDSN